MARTPNAMSVPAEDGFCPERLEQAGQAAMELNDHLRQQEVNVRAVAAQLGYQLPADCTDADLIQRDIAANMRRSVEACLEVGRGLRVLKEACEHGQFLSRLEVLGIDRKVAAKFMQSAAKFANVSSTRHLTAAIGNQTKLFEMLVLDDEQLEELELTGQTGELTLDDVATMSVKELRGAVRELREEKQAITRIATERAAKLDELATQSGKAGKIVIDPWPDEVAGLKDDLHGLGKVMDECLGKVLTLVDATELAMMPHEVGSDAHTGFKTVVFHLDETIERLVNLVAGLRSDYDTRLAHLIAVDKTYTIED